MAGGAGGCADSDVLCPKAMASIRALPAHFPHSPAVRPDRFPKAVTCGSLADFLRRAVAAASNLDLARTVEAGWLAEPVHLSGIVCGGSVARFQTQLLFHGVFGAKTRQNLCNRAAEVTTDDYCRFSHLVKLQSATAFGYKSYFRLAGVELLRWNSLARGDAYPHPP